MKEFMQKAEEARSGKRGGKGGGGKQKIPKLQNFPKNQNTNYAIYKEYKITNWVF